MRSGSAGPVRQRAAIVGRRSSGVSRSANQVVSRLFQNGRLIARFDQFERLAALPPYVLATVDELEVAAARARGTTSSTSASATPTAPAREAAIDRLDGRGAAPGQPALHAVARAPRSRARRFCDWYARRYGPELRSRERGGRHPRLEGGARPPARWRIVGPGDCVLSPDPCYPIHRFGVIIARRRAGPGRHRPGPRPLRRD